LALTADAIASMAVSTDPDGVPCRVRGIYVFPDGSDGALISAAAMGAIGSPGVLEPLSKDITTSFDVPLTRPVEQVGEMAAVD
jgi:hypothetical protein